MMKIKYYFIFIIGCPLHVASVPAVFLTKCPHHFSCFNRNFCDINGLKTRLRNNRLTFTQDNRGLFACLASDNGVMGVCCRDTLEENVEIKLTDTTDNIMRDYATDLLEETVDFEKTENIRLMDIPGMIEKMLSKHSLEKKSSEIEMISKEVKHNYNNNPNFFKIYNGNQNLDFYNTKSENIRIDDILGIENKSNRKQSIKKRKVKETDKKIEIVSKEHQIPIFLNKNRELMISVNDLLKVNSFIGKSSETTTTMVPEVDLGFDLSPEFLLEVLKLINKKSSKLQNNCPATTKCVLRSRCSFLGTIIDQPVKLSEEMEALRVPIEACKSKKKKMDTVCCRTSSFLTEKQEELEDELDLNFDKIFVYQDTKSLGGRINHPARRLKTQAKRIKIKQNIRIKQVPSLLRVKKPPRRRVTGFTTRVSYK